MEEAGLLQQLGIDWKLFLSQAVNFFILLIVLGKFVYKPLLKVIRERNEKIKDGLQKAQQADVRLKEVDEIAKGYLKKADQEAMVIIKDTEDRAKKMEELLVKKAEEKQQTLMRQAQEIYKKQQEENKNLVLAQAGELVKKIVLKTVELKPEAIDDVLVQKAISHIKQHEAQS